MGYLVLAGVVFGVNLLPAFGPPTWAVLVFFRLQSDLAAIPLVLVGALAAALGRLALAPLPSAQLFVAAGLVDAPLVPLTAAFFAGRLVSYTIYVTAASAAKQSLGSIVQSSFTSPFGIALQLLMLAGLIALLRIDWARILTGRRGPHDRERQAREPARQVSRNARPHARHAHARTPPAPSPPTTDRVPRSPHI